MPDLPKNKLDSEGSIPQIPASSDISEVNVKHEANQDSIEEASDREQDLDEVNRIKAKLDIQPEQIDGFEDGLQAMVEKVDALLKKKGQIVLSIAGKTGSGKTVFANRLRDDLSKKGVTSTVVNTDDFYIKGESNLDTEKLHDAIHKLQHGESVGRLQPAQVIIVEGLQTISNSTLGQQPDSRVYIEVPFKERIVRRILRDEKIGFQTIEKKLNILANISDEDIQKMKDFEKDPDMQNVKFSVKNDYVAPDEPDIYIDKNTSTLVFSVAGKIKNRVPVEAGKIPILANEVGIEVK